MATPRTQSRIAAKLLLSAAPLAMIIATPAMAQSTDAGSVSAIAANGAGSTVFSGATSNTAGADTSTITLGNSRTIIDWNSFNLGIGDTMNYVFGANSDIVVNRLASGQTAQINGTVGGYVGAVGGARGGNIWYIAPSGVVAGGSINAGGVLLSTGTISNADFFSNNYHFTGATSEAQVGSGASITANNGAVTVLGGLASVYGNVTASGSIAMIGAKDATIVFNNNLDAYLGVTINEGTANNIGAYVGQAASFNAGAPAAGGKTLILSAASTPGIGNVILEGVSADRVEFVEGDVAIYAAGTIAAPKEMVTGGVVQALGTASGSADVTIGAINVSAGSLDVRAADAITTNQAIAVQGNTQLEAGGLMTVNTAVSTKGDYSIIADDWTGTGVFSPTFTGGAGVGDFNITDTAFGLTIGGRTAPDDLRITTLGGDLTVNAALAATNGNVELTVGGNTSSYGIAVNAPITTGTGAGRSVILNGGGQVTQSAAGVITTNTLSGGAVQFRVNSAANQISNLGTITAFKDILVNDAGGGLGILGNLTSTQGWINLSTPGVLSAGAVTIGSAAANLMELSGSSIALTGTTLNGNMEFHAPVAIGGTVTVNNPYSFYDATFDGAVGGDGLAGADSLVVNGRASFNGGVNNTLSNLTVTSHATVLNNISVANNLTIGGQANVSGTGGVYGTGGSLAFTAGGNIVLSQLWRNYSGQPINLAFTAGNINANSIGLTGNLFTDVTFSGTTTLSGDIAASGSVRFNSPLTLSAGNHNITGGSVLFNGAITAAPANDVQLRVNGTNATTGNVTFNGVYDIDRLAIAARHVGDLMGANRIGTLAFTSAQGATSVENSGLLTIGTVDGIAGLTASAGGIGVSSTSGINLDANIYTSGYLGLNSSGGSINQSQTAGITALGLTIGAGSYEAIIGNALLSGTNDIDRFDGFSYGNIVLRNNGALSLGSLTGATGIDVTTTGNMTVDGVINNSHTGNLSLAAGGNLAVNQNITADHMYTTHGDVVLTAGGLMSRSVGTIVANDIALTAADWTGGILGSSALQELRDVSITDTSGGLTLATATDVRAIRNLSISSPNADLSVGGLVSGGRTALDAGGALTIAGGTSNIGGDLTGAAAGNVVINDRVDSSGNILLRSNGGSVSIGTLGDLRANDVTLSAVTSFSNASGADAITAANRWLVFSANPTANTFGGLNSGNNAYWNATYSGFNASGVSGSRYVFAYQPTLTVATIDASKVYGTDLSGSTGSLYTVTGLQSGVAGAFLGDTASSAFSGAPSINSAGLAANASVAGGPYSVIAAAGTMNSNGGYALAFNSNGKITITPKALTGTVIANNKTYDGTTAATGSVNLSGVVAGDSVTASALLAFADKNAGNNKTVTISGGSLAGTDAGNYSLSLPASALANILQKALTGTVIANNKTYDGTTAATGSVNLSGVVAGDSVTASALLAFADKNAGNNKTVTISGGSLAGTDAGNYSLSLPASALANILQKALTGTVIANNKTYDGTTAATGSVNLSGVVAGDSVTASALLAFADKNAGNNKTVTISGGSLAGTDAGNYSLSLPASALANILQKALTGTVIANNKTYDGTTAATGSVNLSGVVAGDSVTASALLAFADKNAGNNKTVTISGGSLAGTDAGNYSLSLPASALANILQKALTGTVIANNKTYDGTTAATGSVNLSGVVAGDSVTASALLAFADKNAGNNKTVTISGGSLAGTDAGNYSLSLPASALANILQKALTGTVIANNKTYDGTTAATGSVNLSGVVAGDSVTASALLAFADKNAGNNKTVTISGGSLAGTDAGNYSLSLPASALANILQKALTGTVIANNKTYDGTTAATGSVNLSGVVAGDSVTASALLAFADKNAGNNKTVTISGGSLAGTDAGNYSLSLPASALANILQKALTGTVIANNKTYDGTTAATGSVNLSGVVAGDSVTASALLAFADKNAGNNKTVTISGGSLAGTDAGNYSLSLPASALANILQKALTGTVIANNKTYDGTTAATGSVNLSGVVAGDSVTASALLAFADKNAGNNKTVTISGGSLAGTDAGNYSLSLPASALANILQKALTGTVIANNKTYDGTTAATGSVNLSGVVAGDSVTASALLAFADKNAGNNKTVTISGGSLAGTDAGNYSLSLPASALANILQKALTGTVIANNKTYDGTTAATGSVNLSGVVAGDSVTASALLAFADKNAGNNKTVTISGGSLAGTDAGNYSLSLPASALANILQKALTGTVIANNKTYDGTTAATGSVNLSGVVAGDSVTASALLAFADKNAGNNKTVTISGGSLAGTDAGNYSLSLPASALANILQRLVTVTADDVSKIQNSSDPALTFALTNGSLVTGDVFSGQLTREIGELPGVYDILQGSLTAGSNYDLSFVGGELTIEASATALPVGQTELPDLFRPAADFIRYGPARATRDDIRVLDERDSCDAATKAAGRDCPTK